MSDEVGAPGWIPEVKEMDDERTLARAEARLRAVYWGELEELLFNGQNSANMEDGIKRVVDRLARAVRG